MRFSFRKRFSTTGFLAEEGGTELVELALSSVLLFLLVFGIMDCSRAVYINHYLAQAARDGAHYAMLRGGTWSSSCATPSSTNCTASSSNVSSFLSLNSIPGVMPANLTINTTWPGTNPGGTSCNSAAGNAQGCLVNVQVSYAYHFMLPFLPDTGWNMSSTSSAAIVQ